MAMQHNAYGRPPGPISSNARRRTVRFGVVAIALLLAAGCDSSSDVQVPPHLEPMFELQRANCRGDQECLEKTEAKDFNPSNPHGDA